MVHSNALNSYQNQQAQAYEEMTQEQLIHMLYEGAIKRVQLARQGLEKNDPKLRGENLGKAIAIISELNASLDQNIQTEEINFLRSLYGTMLVELPKVAVTGDIKTLERAEGYLNELKTIWEQTAMKKDKKQTETRKPEKPDLKKGGPKGSYGPSTGYPGQQKTYTRTSFAV